MLGDKARSPVQQARLRMEQAKRRENELLARLRQPSSLTEEEAKRIAAALIELMKR